MLLYTDGASRGNPGPAALGYVLWRGAQVIEEGGEAIGHATNNVAEYRALIRGLERARALGLTALTVCSDSQLLVRQLTGEYRVRDVTLQELFRQAQQLARGTVRAYCHVPRALNRRADRLANLALDRA
ncbi:MAG: ribonuclease HI family protein [Deinococcus sp.]|nr:ribonuclease HI family protein [Deinococcus sp.]